MRDEGRRKHRIDTFATTNEAYSSLLHLTPSSCQFLKLSFIIRIQCKIQPIM
jgi:hypothetical protein